MLLKLAELISWRKKYLSWTRRRPRTWVSIRSLRKSLGPILSIPSRWQSHHWSQSSPRRIAVRKMEIAAVKMRKARTTAIDWKAARILPPSSTKRKKTFEEEWNKMGECDIDGIWSWIAFCGWERPVEGRIPSAGKQGTNGIELVALGDKDRTPAPSKRRKYSNKLSILDYLLKGKDEDCFSKAWLI